MTYLCMRTIRGYNITLDDYKVTAGLHTKCIPTLFLHELRKNTIFLLISY